MDFLHTHPSAESNKPTAATARHHPVTTGSGFLRRRFDMDFFDEAPEKKSTQEEQDMEDEKMRKLAMRNLVNSWQERLQLISVITTFFASTEAAMLVNTKPANDTELRNVMLQISNASLLGALIVHVYASVLSFLGAFFLISYKLREAKREELIAEGIVTNSPVGEPVIKDVERGRLQQVPTMQNITQNNTHSSSPSGRYVFAANPHIEQVGLLKSDASPHRILDRTHAICVLLAGVGFILNIIGILCYSWALQPQAVSIFASVCFGVLLLTLIALRL